MTYRPGGERILDIMSDIGYDAMTVGNREFHFSAVGFRAKVSHARFPVLCANVRSHTVKVPTQPYIVDESNMGWRVVVFGLTVPMITVRMHARRFSPFLFDDPLEVAASLVPELHRRFTPDILIALSHLGLGRDRELAAAVPGIDLIIGGHSHDILKSGESCGEGAMIVQAGSHGAYIGRVEVVRKVRKDRPCAGESEDTVAAPESHCARGSRCRLDLSASVEPL